MMGIMRKMHSLYDITVRLNVFVYEMIDDKATHSSSYTYTF